MNKLKMTSSVKAILESWRQVSLIVRAPSHNNRDDALSIRELSPSEKLMITPEYPTGDRALPWFGFFRGDTRLAVSDNYRQLCRQCKQAGYNIVNADQLA